MKEAVDRISKTESQTPLLDAEVLLCHVLNKDRLYLFVNGNEILDLEKLSTFNELVNMRLEGTPISYIIHKQEFMGLDFYVEEGVLIPRPDTEILVEEVIKWAKNHKDDLYIADLGTGSGAITVSLAKYIPNAFLYSVDISQKALSIGKKNGELHGVSERITFLEGDLLKPLKEHDLYDKLDILVSNPPYIPREDIDELQVEVSKYEPRLALDGGLDGLDFYRRIIDGGYHFVKNGGQIALEVGHDQGESVKRRMEQNGFYENIEKVKDLAGIERVVTATVNKVKKLSMI